MFDGHKSRSKLNLSRMVSDSNSYFKTFVLQIA